MSDNRETIPVPAWFTLAAVAAVLFEVFGAYSYLIHVTTDPASLPIDQRDLVQAMPDWMTVAYALAVWTGLAGALLLLLRRRLAPLLLLVSLFAVIVQFSALLVVPELTNLVGPDELLVPFVILLVCYALWHFARHAQKHGWLR